jgi:FixJ family two-component response regulator
MTDATVHIVDDDLAVRDSTALLLSLKGLRTRAFASAEDFLQVWQPALRGCLLLDVRMPGLSGLELMQLLAARGSRLPVIVITAHGDVATARAALKGGALDFLEKPVDEDLLLEVIGNALEFDAHHHAAQASGDARRARLERLTRREREVMELITAGRHNREVAEVLGISARTVEVYRARLMEKLEARNLADLIRLALGEPPPGT